MPLRRQEFLLTVILSQEGHPQRECRAVGSGHRRSRAHRLRTRQRTAPLAPSSLCREAVHLIGPESPPLDQATEGRLLHIFGKAEQAALPLGRACAEAQTCRSVLRNLATQPASRYGIFVLAPSNVRQASQLWVLAAKDARSCAQRKDMQ